MSYYQIEICTIFQSSCLEKLYLYWVKTLFSNPQQFGINPVFCVEATVKLIRFLKKNGVGGENRGF